MMFDSSCTIQSPELVAGNLGSRANLYMFSISLYICPLSTPLSIS